MSSLDFYAARSKIILMDKTGPLHPIQTNILLTLLFKEESRFSSLNNRKVSSDLFNFHLKKLITNDLIEKTHENTYRLTRIGKEYANRFDTFNKKLERQAKIGVLICCKRQILGEIEYLMQQRLKQPYYGFWGFITGKVRWGESIYDTAKREFREETGLSAEFELAGIKHKSDLDDSNRLLEDKFFFVMRATNPEGKLKKEFEGGKNSWVYENNILEIKELFGDVPETLRIANNKYMTFTEIKYKVNKY